MDGLVTVRFAAQALGFSEEVATRWFSDSIQLRTEDREPVLPFAIVLREMSRRIECLESGVAGLEKKLAEAVA